MLQDEAGNIVAQLRGPEAEANAARLALCWNLMPEMQSVLSELVELMEAIREREYAPDSLTTQPARALLAKLTA